MLYPPAQYSLPLTSDRSCMGKTVDIRGHPTTTNALHTSSWATEPSTPRTCNTTQRHPETSRGPEGNARVPTTLDDTRVIQKARSLGQKEAERHKRGSVTLPTRCIDVARVPSGPGICFKVCMLEFCGYMTHKFQTLQVAARHMTQYGLVGYIDRTCTCVSLVFKRFAGRLDMMHL